MKKHNIETLRMYTYAPSLFVLFIVCGAILDSFFPTNTFASTWWQPVGVACITLGTVLTFWAISSLRIIRKKIKEKQGVHMCVGAYKYMRQPDYVSYVFLGFGCGLVLESIIILGLTALFVFVIHVIANRKELHLMSDASPMQEEYTEYKKKVRRFF